MGEGATFREKKRIKVSCTKCGVTVAASYLERHMAWLHGICFPQTRGVNKLGGVPTTYMVSLSRVMQFVRCLVPVCPAVTHSVGLLRENFMYQHFWLQVVVVQKGSEPLPCYELF